MGQLIIKHKVDKSFLKYGLTISVSDFQKQQDKILYYYENKKKVAILIDAKEYPYFGEDGELVPCPYEDTVFYYKEK